MRIMGSFPGQEGFLISYHKIQNPAGKTPAARMAGDLVKNQKIGDSDCFFCNDLAAVQDFSRNVQLPHFFPICVTFTG
jgi:hypothetical protein